MAQYKKQLVSKKELKTLRGIPYSPQHFARLEQAANSRSGSGWAEVDVA